MKNGKNKVVRVVKMFLLFYLFMLMPLTAAAQQRFGYVSYEQVFQMLPEYAATQQNLDILRAKYADETKRAEEEFNKKYEEFLDGQRDFPATILQKRQTELQQLMEKNIAFKEESRRLLEQAQEEAYAPLHQKLAELLQRVGTQRGLAFIINTDQNACPFINPEMGEDVTAAVLALIRN